MADTNITSAEKDEASSVVPFSLDDPDSQANVVNKLIGAASAGDVRSAEALKALKYFHDMASKSATDDTIVQKERVSLYKSLASAKRDMFVGALLSKAGVQAGSILIQAGSDKIKDIKYLSQLITDNPVQYAIRRQSDLLKSASAYLETLAPTISMLPGAETSGFSMQQMQQYAKDTSAADNKEALLNAYVNLIKAEKDEVKRSKWETAIEQLAEEMKTPGRSAL